MFSFQWAMKNPLALEAGLSNFFTRSLKRKISLGDVAPEVRNPIRKDKLAMKKVNGIRTLAILVLMSYSTRVWSQSTQGSILGSVTDPSGAFVPGAQVEARNEATNFVRKTISNDQGFYLIDRLEPGPYTLSLELTGFKKVIRNGLQLVTNGQMRMDFQLEVSSATEQVTVQEVLTPVIETETGQIGMVFDRTMNVHNAASGTSVFSLLSCSSRWRLDRHGLFDSGTAWRPNRVFDGWYRHYPSARRSHGQRLFGEQRNGFRGASERREQFC